VIGISRYPGPTDGRLSTAVSGPQRQSPIPCGKKKKEKNKQTKPTNNKTHKTENKQKKKFSIQNADG